MGWSIRSILVMLGWLLFFSCALGDVEESVLRLRVETREGRSHGSAVVITGQRIATVKHVIDRAESVSVEVGGRSYSLTMIGVTAAADGAAILVGDFPDLPELEIADGPPPVGDQVTVYGYGDKDQVEHYTGTVTTGGSFGRGRRSVRGNIVDSGRVVPGDSGGPAIDAQGRVAGLVMLGGEDDVVLCSWASLDEMVRKSEAGSRRRKAPVGDVVTIYTSPFCTPCRIAKEAFAAGRFVDLGVSWDVVDVTRLRRPPVSVTPAFGYRGQVYEPGFYRESDVRRWIVSLQGASGGQSSAASDTPMVDSIDWTGVRFGVLVSEAAPDFMSRLKAPVQRALDLASGSQVPIEVFREGSTEFTQIREAIGADFGFTLYPFATLDKVADVGLVKGMVLKRLERAFDQKLSGETNELMPDLIFRRSDSRMWRAVTSAMGERPVRAGLPPPVVVGLGDSTDSERSWAASIVAFVVSLLGAMKTVRIIRGFYQQQTEKLLEQTSPGEGESESLESLFGEKA